MICFNFFQYCGFETLANFSIFLDFFLIYTKNENVEFVLILFESHFEYSPKKHSSWDFCSKVNFDEHPLKTF
jgi:hypothetical protein